MNDDYIIENNSSNIINLDQNINNAENNIKPISPINSNNIPDSNQPDDFVNSLPDWDLVPPYESVRRINRI